VQQKKGYVKQFTPDGRHIFVKEERVVQDATPQSNPQYYIPPNTDHPAKLNTAPVLQQYFMENTILKSEVNSLKQTTHQQNQWLSLLVQQMTQQNVELNQLRAQLQMDHKLIRVTHPNVINLSSHTNGSYDLFSDSSTHGVMVFENYLSTTDSTLLAYNRAVCNFFNLNAEKLRNQFSTWLTMDINRPKSPLVLFNIVKQQKTPSNIFFVCSFPSTTGFVDVRINIMIEEKQWWLVFDFSNFLIKQAEDPDFFQTENVIQKCSLTDSRESTKIPLSPDSDNEIQKSAQRAPPTNPSSAGQPNKQNFLFDSEFKGDDFASLDF